MDTVAILPIKSFGHAKQRLSDGLSGGERKALAEAMFSDVLLALRRAELIDEILVVSADSGAQQIAGGYGAQIVADEDHGHNPAARRGIRHAIDQGARRVLLIPGDCPMIDPAEIDGLLARSAPERSVLIVPDRHGTGTNALLLRPPDVLAPSFGPGSCARHLSEANADGAAGEVVQVPSLGLDIDTPEDLTALDEQLSASHGGAAHTRGMLRQLMRSRS